ncbi:MAG: hypothetical protein FJY95_18215 [Candidatus Handelsmanbacteria bacterium]|nr:hypothetical protein [Candidatus Handelsmanbacteria bacterium]
MKKFCLIGALALAVCASQADAQLQYDPFFGLPGKTGTMGVDAGLASADLGAIGDASDVFVMGKYAVSDKLEVGARATLGFLFEGADTFNRLDVGAKYGLGEKSALAVNLLAPLGGVDDPGLAVGYMNACSVGGVSVNGVLQAQLLKGYADPGVNLNLFLEPYKAFGEKMIGYLDLYVNTNTDDIGNTLGVNLGPNVDIKLNDTMVLNAGVSLGLAGDAKQADPGLGVTLIYLAAK